MNDVLEANEKDLRKIYTHYHTSVKKYMNYDDALSMCTREANLNVADKDVLFCFAMSKMMVTNEVSNYDKYNKMLWPEFLEFIGRLADIKFKHSPEMS